MSDESSAQTSETDEGQTTEQAGTQPKPTETVDFWKSKAREQEKRAKDNAEAARRLAEMEESAKSDTQRAAEQLTAATTRAEQAEASLLRYEVAAEKGVPSQAIKFLTGSTREEMEASAKDVLELIGEAGKPRAPKPDPSQGRSGSGTATTADQFAAAVGDLL